MAGPYLDPKKAAEFEKGFNESGTNPKEMLNKVASMAGLLNREPPAPSNAITAPMIHNPGPAQLNDHMMKMQQAAEEAKRKYMQQFGVDENGNPIGQ